MLARTALIAAAACLIGAALILGTGPERSSALGPDRPEREVRGPFAPPPLASRALPPRTPHRTSTPDHPAHFPSAELCSDCHSTSEASTALTTDDGADVSQSWLWQGTMMAQAFVDPYWRAQLEDSSRTLSPEAGSELETLCVRCHAPAAHHGALLRGEPAPDLAAASHDPIAFEGVTCSFCHRISGTTMVAGVPDTGELVLGPPGVYSGPIEQPALRSTADWTEDVPLDHAYDYIFEDSSICAPCHTLRTSHAPGAESFLEQSPYLEWQNSVYSDQPFPTRESRSCQECHMPRADATRLARHPSGHDVTEIPEREHFETHAFVGANAFMLDLMADHADELGVVADPDALRHGAQLARGFLAERTARVRAGEASWLGGRLRFDVDIENLAGHRFPSAYPSRRAFLEVVVRRGGEVVFSSGTPDATGRLLGDGIGVRPHVNRIRRSSDILVYEMVPGDADGEPTTTVVAMASRLKDNRLLPKGWQPSGPNADETGPVAIGRDRDFRAGSDRVAIDVPVAGRGTLDVIVRLHYQAIPPHWVDHLRDNETPHAERFLRMYDGRVRTTEAVDEVRVTVEK